MATEQESGAVNTDSIETETFPAETQKPVTNKKAKKSKKAKVPTKKKKVKVKKPVYNVDIDPDTGIMRLQEIYLLKLRVAEQKVMLQDRDELIAKTNAREFQRNANQQLQVLQDKVQEKIELTKKARLAYLNEVKFVESQTGLKLAEWGIDDGGVLRELPNKALEEKAPSS